MRPEEEEEEKERGRREDMGGHSAGLSSITLRDQTLEAEEMERGKRRRGDVFSE